MPGDIVAAYLYGAYKVGSLPVPNGRIPRDEKELGKNPLMWFEFVEHPYTFGKSIPFNRNSNDFETVNFLTDLDSRCPVSSQVAFKGIRANVEPADKGKAVLQKKIG